MHTVIDSAIRSGAGQFGAIYKLTANAKTAFKVVKDPSISEGYVLEDEFNKMAKVYNQHLINTHLFIIPQPLACWIRNEDSTTTIRYAHGAINMNSGLTMEFEKLKPSNSTYAMEAISPLPLELSKMIAAAFFPSLTTRIHLCRLYLGKESKSRSRFVNSRNFQLCRIAYRELYSMLPNLPSPESLAKEMGAMLGMIHALGYDGRDIEFALGGHQIAAEGFAFYTFDFNQMRRHKGSLLEDAKQLRDSFFLNDPYFPRPNPEDELYQSFKLGYCCYTASLGILVNAFFAAIEDEKAKRLV